MAHAAKMTSRLLASVVLALAVAGCANLPEPAPHAPTTPIAGLETTPLARIAAESTPPAKRHLSGFRLLPSGEHAFDARIALARHAQRRLDAQYYLLAADAAGRQFLRDEHGITLDSRIGLHIGEAAIGSMGRETRTALGDAVNVAFSIEALTRIVDRPALASASFLEDWDDGRDLFEACGEYPIKGHSETMQVFAPRRLAF